ncbi:hypothetical protein D3C81_888260 [compost metagenome]
MADPVGVLFLGTRCPERRIGVCIAALAHQRIAQGTVQAGILRVLAQCPTQLCFGFSVTALVEQRLATLARLPGRVGKQFALLLQVLVGLRQQRRGRVALQEGLPGSRTGGAHRLPGQVVELALGGSIACARVARQLIEQRQRFAVAVFSEQPAGQGLAQPGAARVLPVQLLQLADRFRALPWQVAAHAPVVQRQLKAGRLTCKQLLIRRQCVFIAPGNGQQARLLQAPHGLWLLQFEQAHGLACLKAARRQSTDPDLQLLGLGGVLVAQRQVQGGQQHIRVTRLQQLQPAQRIAHQVVTVQRLAPAHLVQQPLALFVGILGLRCGLACHRCQHQHTNHSLHGALQAGNRRPCGSKR